MLRVRVNDQSGATWEDAMKRLRAGLFFSQVWDVGGGEFIGIRT